MSEWWTYCLSDFLMFSPRTYHRLFELANADIWPLQIVAIAAGLAACAIAPFAPTSIGTSAAALAAAAAVAASLHRRIGGLTGDCYGAAVEIAETVFLAAASLR